jgi:hypothetical protein
MAYAFDRAKYGDLINWDKYSFIIHGQRVFLLGGEFHYWRVPDRERWRDILSMYKAAGLNSLRIYFHWGFHNTAENVFNFEGNRDVDYLLSLCEELGFWVFVAAGPYICAETTAGGYPLWLVAKRHVHIKHTKGTLRQKYDEEYMGFCQKWYAQFIAQIKSHQITENQKGCIIGYQIENEYIEKMVVIKAQRRYMEELVRYAREAGLTVPMFHDDALEANSWNGVVDIYGFNKYILRFTKDTSKPWDPAMIRRSTDKTEKHIDSFGPPANQNPIFIPEFQGGWYNHWGMNVSYDDLYTWYGPTYQKLILESICAQRCTAQFLYMFYGGTNYGSIINPEVYTSYDYSACIREYGFLSDRFRYTRLFNLFVCSFQDSLCQTEPADLPSIICTEPDIYYAERKSHDGTNFYFLRNFNKSGRDAFEILYPSQHGIEYRSKCSLPPRESFIAVGNHKLGKNVIELCTLPIIIRNKFGDGHILVVSHNMGELILKGTGFELTGEGNVVVSENMSHLSFQNPGMCVLSHPVKGKLIVICLSNDDALTLNAKFPVDLNLDNVDVAWGAYSIAFPPTGQMKIETIGVQDVFLLRHGTPPQGFTRVDHPSVSTLFRKSFGHKLADPHVELTKWARFEPDWKITDAIQGGVDCWKPIDIDRSHDPLDHRFMNGHILYKCEFTPSSKAITLKINIRHKAGIWLNGHFIGGQFAYSTGFVQAGAMNGPDPTFLGTKKHDLSQYILPNQLNTLFILVETLGQSKIFWLLNDVRNPRGILQVKFSQKNPQENWFIGGIDVAEPKDPFNISGFPQESLWLDSKNSHWKPCEQPVSLSPDDQVQVWKTVFQWKKEDRLRCPLYIRIEGVHNVNIFLNENYIGRYWGSYGPQNNFYLPDGFLRNGENMVSLIAWTTHAGEIKIQLLPYYVDRQSGNFRSQETDANSITFQTSFHCL